jgi:hypothetical protein
VEKLTAVVVERALMVSPWVAAVNTPAWSAARMVVGDAGDVPLKKKLAEFALVGMLTLVIEEPQAASEKKPPVPPEAQ